MAQTIGSTAVGRVNRRFMFLALILAVLSAVLVYAAVSRSGEGGGTGGETTVVVAKSAIPAGTQITADMVEAREVSESSLGDQAYTTVEEVVGQVARYPMAANEQVLVSKVVGGSQVARNDVLSHILEGGMRGMAVRADVMVGAGGLVLPGDHVDVFWVPERVLEDHDGAGLVAENVEVIAVEQVLVELPAVAPGLTEDGQQPAGNPDDERIRGSEAEPIPDAATVTLMLTPEQAARIFCAELSGTLRLGVRAFGDESPSGLAPFTCALLADRETAQ